MIGINMCMPKKCSECPCVQVDYEGNIDPCCCAKYDWSKLSDKEYSEQKPDWCPLIDLDTPVMHGPDLMEQPYLLCPSCESVLIKLTPGMSVQCPVCGAQVDWGDKNADG